MSLFKEDDIFSNNTNLTYGPHCKTNKKNKYIYIMYSSKSKIMYIILKCPGDQSSVWENKIL